MKPLYTLLLFASYFICVEHLKGQTLEERLNQRKPTCQEVFANAMDVLPELKKSSSFDSIRFVVDFIDRNCVKSTENFDLKVLLAIQLDQFRVEDFYDDTSITNLQLRATGYEFYMRYPRSAVKAQADYYLFTSNWALELINQKKLDSNETLICKVMAGIVKSPALVIQNSPSEYPYLYNLLKISRGNARKRPLSYVTLMGGYWVPTNNLKILGSHPSIGFQVGQHSFKNDFALTIQFRFMRAANQYKVFRDDSLYSLTHFFGGYIGLDYTRYLLRNDNVELGLMGGIGYDGFDISGSKDDDYLKPLSIGSLNLNTGLRFNYFYTTSNFIGLQARYNLVNYRNKGGSSFKGDSFSIDLLLGFH